MFCHRLRRVCTVRRVYLYLNYISKSNKPMQCNTDKVILPAIPRVHSRVGWFSLGNVHLLLGCQWNKTRSELAKPSLCKDFLQVQQDLWNAKTDTCWSLFTLCKRKVKLSQNWEKFGFILHLHRKSQQRKGQLGKFSIGLGRLPSLNVKQFGWYQDIQIQRIYFALNDCSVDMILYDNYSVETRAKPWYM